jgi:hypothetical protein
VPGALVINLTVMTCLRNEPLRLAEQTNIGG